MEVQVACGRGLQTEDGISCSRWNRISVLHSLPEGCHKQILEEGTAAVMSLQQGLTSNVGSHVDEIFVNISVAKLSHTNKVSGIQHPHTSFLSPQLQEEMPLG